MTADLELSLKQFLREVVHEVAATLVDELRTSASQDVSQPTAQESNLLLTPREAAKRLAISERHLHGLTRSGQLPCVRIGRSVRYNVEMIQKWIRDTESTDRPPSSETSESQQLSPLGSRFAAPRRKLEVVKRRKQAVRRTTLAAPQPEPRKVPQPKSKKGPQQIQTEERISPFSLLLNELGIGRSDLPPITNGDLRRVAEVDIPTIHGWLYLGKSLPEEALNRLKSHYLRLVKGRKDLE